MADYFEHYFCNLSFRGELNDVRSKATDFYFYSYFVASAY